MEELKFLAWAMIINFFDCTNQRNYLVMLYRVMKTSKDILRVLPIFYILLMLTSTNTLLSKQLREFIQTNRMAQHIIGCIAMTILLSLLSNETSDMLILRGILYYAIFVMTTKLDLPISIIVIVLIFFGYMYQNDVACSTKRMQDDPNITQDTKCTDALLYCKYRPYIWTLVGIITTLGVCGYMYKKKKQYGTQYNLYDFITK